MHSVWNFSLKLFILKFLYSCMLDVLLYQKRFSCRSIQVSNVVHSMCPLLCTLWCIWVDWMCVCVCVFLSFSLLPFLFTNFDSAWLTSSFRAPAASKIHTLYGQWSGKDQSGQREKSDTLSHSLHYDTGTLVMHVTLSHYLHVLMPYHEITEAEGGHASVQVCGK